MDENVSHSLGDQFRRRRLVKTRCNSSHDLAMIRLILCLTLKTLRGVPDGPQRSFFWRPALLVAESFLILLLCVKVLCQFNMDWVNWIFFLKT